MFKVRNKGFNKVDFMKALRRQVAGKKISVTCPNCGATNRINIGDIMDGGGKEVPCVRCHSVFRMTGEKKS